MTSIHPKLHFLSRDKSVIEFAFAIGAEESRAVFVLAQQHILGQLITAGVAVHTEDFCQRRGRGVDNRAVGAGFDG